jgi:hypothetical protein
VLKADLSSPTDPAPPRSGASARSVVERLDEAECMELLSTTRIGRLIYNSRYGPVALPSEYKIHEGSIVFPPTGSSSPKRTCVPVSRTPSTKSPWRSTKPILKRARDGWYSSGAQPIT